MGSRFSDFLFSLLPFLREVIHHIVTVHIPCFAGDEDKRLWIPDNHGIFSTKSAVDVICYQKEEGHSLCLLLSPASCNKSGMPLKSSFLVLRAIQDRLPLDINIQRLGISLASKCICCPESAFEEVTHIFLHGSWVVQLWTHYQNIFLILIQPQFFPAFHLGSQSHLIRLLVIYRELCQFLSSMSFGGLAMQLYLKWIWRDSVSSCTYETIRRIQSN